MNFIFISPAFPKNYYNFCDRLKKNNVKKNIIDKVNIPVIKRTALLKNNKTGITGVSYDSKRRKSK